MNRVLWCCVLLSTLVMPTHAAQRAPCSAPSNTTLIEFRSGENTLRGFLDLPSSPGPHPLVVTVQGSGTTDVTIYTEPFAEMRAAFKRAGVATLIWDKAGNGCSDGKYSHGFALRERASETLAAVKAMRKRPDIDATRIGLWGDSQGGWVAPMAAVRLPEIAFVILVSGPGRDATAQTIFDALGKLRASGVSATEVDAAQGTLLRAFAVARAGGSSQEFLTIVAPLKKYAVLRDARMLDASSRGFVTAVQRIPDWSLSADLLLREVRQPTLAIFGEGDTTVDWRESIDVYRDSFARSGNRDLTIRTFKNAGHSMVALPDALQRRESLYIKGYVDAMVDWLRTHGFTGTKPDAER